jgi:predicted transcriptional regulator YheO
MQTTTLRKPFTRIVSTVVPAILIAGVSVYAIAHKPDVKQHPPGFLPGTPLASYPDLYPVKSDDQGQLYLDKARFVKAVDYFEHNPSPKAVSDLIYLGQSNNVSLTLNDQEKGAYKGLMASPAYADLPQVDQQRDRVFQVYRDIVNGIGQTFSGTGVEIVLHDTRNPLHSVVAIQNPISGRRLGDSTTNFGLELIKTYSVVDRQGSSYVSYPLTLKDGRQIKSSTIPLFDETYGLVGFICMNIDISKLDAKDHPEEIASFIESFKMVTSNDKIAELIENSKRKKS